MLSVVIPALDSGATLGACLAALADQADEICVVDGGSRDDSRALAEAAGARVILSPKGRGLQLQAGGRTAQGDWLLFLHSDTRLAGGWRGAVDAHVQRWPGKAGCLRFRLDDPAWQARAIERGVAARVRLFGLPYGDQGLLVPRTLYDQVGGFRPLPLMEDVDLVRRIGRRRMRILAADALTSGERWQKDGWVRRSLRNGACLALYGLGLPPEKVARLYES